MIDPPMGKFQTAVQKIRQRSFLVWLIALPMIALVLYFLLPPALNRVARALIREDPLTKADLIVALGGDSRSNREKRAAELYKQGWGKKVIVSGVQITWGIHTADTARQYLVSLGVPDSDILAIRDAWNTRGEAEALNKLMAANGWHSAIVVTSAFHSRRALFTLERDAAEQQFHSSPVAPVFPEWQPDHWWSRRLDLGITLKEFFSWANTIVDGWK